VTRDVGKTCTTTEYRSVSAKLAIASVRRMNAFDDRREMMYVLMLVDLLDIARTLDLAVRAKGLGVSSS
jgi:hypothetical protein